MRCPHCDIGIHRSFQKNNIGVGKATWGFYAQLCPECDREIIELEGVNGHPPHTSTIRVPRYTAYPANASSRSVPAEVSDPYKQDFIEACAVLPLSAKASAALSRRNLHSERSEGWESNHANSSTPQPRAARPRYKRTASALRKIVRSKGGATRLPAAAS